VTALADQTARLWNVQWVTLVRGRELRGRFCSERLVGVAQEFTGEEQFAAIAHSR
jgi:hypothetical protein